MAVGADDWLVLGCSEYSLKWSRDIKYQITENDCKWNSKLGTEKIFVSGNSDFSHPSFSGYTDYVAGFLTEPVFFMYPICHVSKWPSHLPRPTTNQLSLSAPQFQTSLRKKKPTDQDDLLQWGYTNPMSQRTLSLIQSAVARSGAGLCRTKKLGRFTEENVWLKFANNDVSV